MAGDRRGGTGLRPDPVGFFTIGQQACASGADGCRRCARDRLLARPEAPAGSALPPSARTRLAGMIRTLTRIALAVSGLFLAGCWQADGSLYGKATPVTPFHAGAITETGGKQGTQHFALTLGKDGTYRMIGTDKGEDHGEGFALRFFNLRGIPENMYVYEATSL